MISARWSTRAQGRLGADAAAGRRRGGRLMTANRLLPAAIAALALAGAAHAQETDSDVASTGEQVFRHFPSHPFAGTKNSGVRRCVQVRSIGEGRRSRAVRSRRRPYRLLLLTKTAAPLSKRSANRVAITPWNATVQSPERHGELASSESCSAPGNA